MMDNTDVEKDLYDEEAKHEFLGEFSNERTMRTYRRVFRLTRAVEEFYGKDLMFFTKEEINKLFREIEPPTTASARTTGGMVLQYISWAIAKNKRKGQHPLHGETGSYFQQFVQKREHDYLKYDDVMLLTSKILENYQDSVIIQLLFEGVEGHEVSELLNLTWNNCNTKTNEVHLFDDNPKRKELGIDERTITVSDHCMHLIKEAYLEKRYYKKNGEMEHDNPRIKEYVDIPSMDYVIRSASTNKTNKRGCSKYTVYGRIRLMHEFPEIDAMNIKVNAKNLKKSGMIYLAKKLYEEKYGEINLELIREVCKQFAAVEHWSLRDFINVETIERVYGKLEFKGKKNTVKQ